MMAACDRKKDILTFTRQVITHRGIRAFRVEEVARVMGMSKRTIYRLFPTRTDLLKTCLVEMNREYYSGQSPEEVDSENDSFTGLVNLLKQHLARMYEVEIIFLLELKQLPDFAEIYRSQRREWLMRMEKSITLCQRSGYILTDTDPLSFCERMLNAIYESRLGAVSSDSQYVLCYTLLRGVATAAGIARLEKIKCLIME